MLTLKMVRGRREAHNPTLAKIMRLAYDRSHSHNRPQTPACNGVYSINRRALLITRLGEHLPRPRQVSMPRNAAAQFTRFTFAHSGCGAPSSHILQLEGREFTPETAKNAHTFSAFWLRSSVVSVLISLISDMWAMCPLRY